MGIIKSKEVVKKEEVSELSESNESLDVEKTCSFCSKEATFIGKFESTMFSIPVLVCKDHLAGMVNHYVSIESEDKHILPDFSEVSK